LIRDYKALAAGMLMSAARYSIGTLQLTVHGTE